MVFDTFNRKQNLGLQDLICCTEMVNLVVPMATIYCLFLVSPVQGWAKWLQPSHCQFVGVLFGLKDFIYSSEFSIKWPCLHPVFGPPFTPIPFLSEVCKGIFYIKSGYETLELGSWCTSFESNYSGCTGRSNKNIFSISGGAQEKREREREGHNRIKLSLPQKKWCSALSFTPPLMIMYFFAGFFWISPGFGQKSGFWCFPDFTENSNSGSRSSSSGVVQSWSDWYGRNM